MSKCRICDGLEAARRIRALEARARGPRRMPILALTANAPGDDHAECLAAGMDGHLSKPFDRQDLDEAIATPRRAAAAQPETVIKTFIAAALYGTVVRRRMAAGVDCRLAAYWRAKADLIVRMAERRGRNRCSAASALPRLL